MAVAFNQEDEAPAEPSGVYQHCGSAGASPSRYELEELVPWSADCSGSAQDRIRLIKYNTSATPAATFAYIIEASTGVGLSLRNDVAINCVTNANGVPSMRPPTFAAKLSPVPRRCSG